MRSVESFLKIYSYTILLAWKRSLRKILCLKEIFDLGAIHKGRTHFRGVSKKYTNAGRGCVGLQLKVDVPLKKLYHISLNIFSQIICKPEVCWCHYSWIFVTKAPFLVHCRGANSLINTDHCIHMGNFLLFQSQIVFAVCPINHLIIHANQVLLYIALTHSI